MKGKGPGLTFFSFLLFYNSPHSREEYIVFTKYFAQMFYKLDPLFMLK